MGVLYNEIEQKKLFKEFSSLLSFGLFPTYQKIFRLKVRLKYPVKYSGTPPSSLSPPFFTMEGGGNSMIYRPVTMSRNFNHNLGDDNF